MAFFWPRFGGAGKNPLSSPLPGGVKNGGAGSVKIPPQKNGVRDRNRGVKKGALIGASLWKGPFPRNPNSVKKALQLCVRDALRVVLRPPPKNPRPNQGRKYVNPFGWRKGAR
ncbi:hypothetical protein JTE90_023465 [Oedothorax gibbosus]|uniref:Uncharacterized protein n=1 Tax=Oedothorax gibbosus TaxID=931172 RepID=A0AAV6TJI0_9ARAC|nr:hypothetical protein JTE90_023465 [Oedothorax gibbosus]